MKKIVLANILTVFLLSIQIMHLYPAQPVEEFATGAEGNIYSDVPANVKYTVLNEVVEKIYTGVFHDYLVRDKEGKTILLEIEEKIKSPDGENIAYLWYRIDIECSDSMYKYSFTDVEITLPTYDEQGEFIFTANMPLKSFYGDVVEDNWKMVKIIQEHVDSLSSIDTSKMRPNEEKKHVRKLAYQVTNLESMYASHKSAVYIWEYALLLIEARV